MSPAPVFVRIPGSHHPGIRLRLIPGFRDPGSVLILGQVTQYGNPYLICITLYSITLFFFPQKCRKVPKAPPPPPPPPPPYKTYRLRNGGHFVQGRLVVNSLWSSDAIMRQGTESTLVQVMACCLTAPSHYLKQCWLIIRKVLWHWPEGVIMRRSGDTNQ